MKRTFIAFDIIPSRETKAAYDHIRTKLRQEKIVWVQEHQFHITVKFLGDTPEETIPGIIDKLSDILGLYPVFSIKIKSMGVFKSLRDPRIIWLGCVAEPVLENLHKAIEIGFSSIGFETENRKYSPHLSIGRVKMMRQVNHLAELIVENNEVEFQQLLVREIMLYESQLKPSGAVYTPLHTFKLL
jgi:2'-5' RNA ligase